MKGQRFPSELRIVPQPETGATLHQITAAETINHATYFLQSSLAPDGRTLLFTSYRGGDAQLYAVDGFPGGEIVQWTSGPAIHPFSAAFHPDGERVFFVRGGAIWWLNWHTLEERLVWEWPGGQLGEVSLSADGRRVTAACKLGAQQGLAVAETAGGSGSFLSYPRTVIHPQFHPLDPDWIEFAADPAPRMHRIRYDGSGLECLYQHGNDEFVVHETFLGKTGDLVYTVWPFALWRMNWETRERTKICDFNAWHITPDRAGRRVLCDTNHPDRGIFLIDAESGEATPVCLSRASGGGSQWKTSRYALPADFAAARSAAGEGALSWMEVSTDTVYGPQWTHPHPSFTPDEKWAIFTSDCTGHPQVYAVQLP